MTLLPQQGQLRLLAGFIAGFVCAFVLLLCIYDVRHPPSPCWTSSSRSSLSLISPQPLKPGQLQRRRLRILCMVLTCPDYLERFAKHVYATWGQRCSKLVFVSSESYEPLGVVKIMDPSTDSYENLWNKTREGFRYVYEMYGEQYDWFLKADDDTYVIMENLEYMLYAYDADMPVYFGYKMSRYNVSYMSGGASYILSREALRRFNLQAYNSSTICPEPKLYGIEDFYMGICLQNVGIRLIDSRYATTDDRKSKLFPLDLDKYLYNSNLTLPDWLHDMSSSEIETGLACCSNHSIAFHYTTPEHMYLYEFLIYRLQVFGANRPAQQVPMRLSWTQVSESFPLEQNLDIKDLRRMSKKPDNF